MATRTSAEILNIPAEAAAGRVNVTDKYLPPDHPTDTGLTQNFGGDTGTNPKPIRTFRSNAILFWQINLQKSMKATQELAFRLAHLSSKQPFVVLIQEPYFYKGTIPYLKSYGKLHHSTAKDGCRASILTSPHLMAWCVNENLSCDVCACAIVTDDRMLYVVSAYHDITLFPVMQELEAILNSNPRSPVIIGSDTNAHSTTWGCDRNNTRGDQLEEFIANQSLSIANVGRQPTFVTSAAQTIIDVTLTNMPASSRIFNWRVNDSASCSDHKYIEFEFSWLVLTTGESKFNFRKGIWTNLSHVLPYWKDEGDLPPDKDHIDQEGEQIILDIKEGIRKVCPTTTRYTPRPALPKWWTSSLTKLREKFRIADRKWRNTGSDEELEAKLEARREYQFQSRKEKREAWRRFCSDIESTPDTSRITKMLKPKPFTEIGLLRRTDGTHARTPLDSVDLLLATHFPDSTLVEGEEWDAPGTPNGLAGLDVDSVISLDKVRSVFRDFSPYKAAGEDEIPPIALQNLDLPYYTRLQNLYVAILRAGYTPTAWRRMKVIFIPKPGKDDYGHPKAYRPISLSSFLFKGLEKLLQWHLQSTVLRKPLCNQYAFTKGCSTDHAISTFVDKVEHQITNGKFAMCASLDIEGAFDNVTFQSIKSAMTRLGIHSAIVNWYDHFLQYRIVTTSIKGITAKRQPKKGTPQGGVLSALVWIMVMDRLQSTMKTHPSLTLCFADDIILLVTGPDSRTLRDLLQEAVNRVVLWGKQEGLRFNPAKTAITLFTRRYKTPTLPCIKLNGVQVPYTSSFRYLGVIIDSKLNWTEHIDSRVKKCKSLLFAANNMVGREWGLTPKRVYWIYTTVIRPILTYGCLVWAQRAPTFLTKLQKLQRLALVAMTGCMRSTPTLGLEVITGLQPLDIFIESLALKARMRTRALCPSRWDGLGANKSTISGHQHQLDKTLASMFHPPACTSDITPQRRWLPWQQGLPSHDGNDLDTLTEAVGLLELNSGSGGPTGGQVVLSCFTDGSREQDRTGAGWLITIGDTIIHEGTVYLGEIATVYQAEVYAIFKVTEWLIECGDDVRGLEVAIYSDSLAAVNAIHNSMVKDVLILKCVHNFDILLHRCRIRLEWVRGHDDNTGNEAADMLAKQGNHKREPDAPPEVTLPVPKSYVKRTIHERAQQIWRERWTNESTCRQTRLFVPDLWHKPHKIVLTTQDKKRETRKLVEIITGHGYLAYAKFKRQKIANPTCRLCKEKDAMETPFHMLLECPALALERQTTLNSIIAQEDLGTIPISSMFTEIGRFFSEDRMASLMNAED